MTNIIFFSLLGARPYAPLIWIRSPSIPAEESREIVKFHVSCFMNVQCCKMDAE